MRLVRKRYPYGIISRLSRCLTEQIQFRGRVKGTHGSITLVDVTILQDPAFVTFTQEALALIEATYPRGYRRILKEIRYIVNNSLLSGGNYEREIQGCNIDFERAYKVAKDDLRYEWYLACYAATLIHEAAHGRIDRFSIPYNKKTRVRIERICRAEERRFTSRLRGKNHDLSRVAPPFDPADWENMWQLSRREKAAMLWDRLKRDLKEQKQREAVVTQSEKGFLPPSQPHHSQHVSVTADMSQPIAPADPVPTPLLPIPARWTKRKAPSEQIDQEKV